MKIMIIDDEPDICFILTYEIRSMGHAPIAFETTDAAQNYLLENKVDAIICDLQMPKLNGLELFKWLKKNQKSIPFILLTGDPGLNPQQLLDEGINCILLKPQDLTEIQATLNKIFLCLKD
jgi:DNA-binding response OmpR family regulator